MNFPPERQWWSGKARANLPQEVTTAASLWQAQRHNKEIEHFDSRSRLKVLLLFAGFFAVAAAYCLLPSHAVLTAAAMLSLAAFFIPYTRVFMHSQMHWGMGGNRVTRFLLDHFISLLFSVSQTSYAVGHRMHHRHDNDISAGGRPRDLQSTYMFARGSRPSPIWLWVPYYMFVFQHMIAPWLVWRNGRRSEKLWFVVETAVIVAFHLALWQISAAFYLSVYVPGLLLAWMGSAVVLYMMHAVDATDYHVHPTNTCVSPFFNSFGDNDGYHLEHSLYPGVHPLYLPRLHALMGLDSRQVLTDHYFVAGLKYAFSPPQPRRSVAFAATASPMEPQDANFEGTP